MLELKELIEKSNLHIDKEKITYNEPMKKHTTFKIGGLAEAFIKIDNLQDLKEILEFANKNKIKITVIGNGSNILVLDSGIKGIVLKINLNNIEIEEKEKNEQLEVVVSSGVKMAMLAQKLLQNEITGFEELAGIPGTIGGAVKMNAGAHGKEMKDIVKTVKIMDYNGDEKELKNEDLEFGYRTSIFKNKKYIITQVKLILDKGNKEEIQEKMNKYANLRKENQPLEYPSAGSTFKRGNGFITAKLIDEAGLKGYSIGDAMVSNKHAGFVINKGNATSQDILELVKHIKKEVKNKFNEDIELEIEVIGEK